jgi:hypothetical protein
MLLGKDPIDFKKAVYLTENAYFDNQLNENVLNNTLEFYLSVCDMIMKSGNIIYPEKDSLRAAAQCAVFVFMTDTIPIMVNGEIHIHTPFAYNFDEFATQKEVDLCMKHIQIRHKQRQADIDRHYK